MNSRETIKKNACDKFLFTLPARNEHDNETLDSI